MIDPDESQVPSLDDEIATVADALVMDLTGNEPVTRDIPIAFTDEDWNLAGWLRERFGGDQQSDATSWVAPAVFIFITVVVVIAVICLVRHTSVPFLF